jgi:GTP-binding protein Era
MLYLRAEISVERDTQKGILVGRGGEMIKKIGSQARRDLEAFFSTRVYLDLTVRVREGWRGDRAWLSRLGYGP